MSARKILSIIIGMSIAAAGAAAGSAALAQTRVVVGDPSSPTGIIGRSLVLFKERAEKYSGGELKVELYPDSQLGTFGAMATQMKINLVNVMFIQPDALGEQIPIVTANSWPFLFNNQDEMVAAWNGPNGKALIAVENLDDSTSPDAIYAGCPATHP